MRLALHARHLLVTSFIIAAAIALPNFSRCENAQRSPLRVGWIGPMSGVAAKYAAWEAAQIAVELINSEGGIAGRPLKLIAEDGQCNAASALSAAKKLISHDKVSYVLGGHCSSESVAIAPVLRDANILQLASLSSSPHLSGVGPLFFRMTSPASFFMDFLARDAAAHGAGSSIALLHEETEYSRGEASAFLEELQLAAPKAPLWRESFDPGTTDFRVLIQRIQKSGAENLFISAQGPDTVELILRQAAAQKLRVTLYGGSVVTNAVRRLRDPVTAGFRSLDFSVDSSHPRTAQLLSALRSRFAIQDPPLGRVTAEAFDAPFLLKAAIERCGDSTSAVARCFTETQEFSGASGRFSFDSKHDPRRQFSIAVWDGQQMVIQPAVSN